MALGLQADFLYKGTRTEQGTRGKLYFQTGMEDEPLDKIADINVPIQSELPRVCEHAIRSYYKGRSIDVPFTVHDTKGEVITSGKINNG
jgi:hypothetical protein